MICPECRDVISDNCLRCAGAGWVSEEDEDDQDFGWPDESESIHDRPERRSDEVLRADGRER